MGKCIVVGEQSYIFEHARTEEIVRCWRALMEAIDLNNAELYTALYRKQLGIEEVTDFDEEYQRIREIFGSHPADNSTYLKALQKSRVEYERQEEHYPVFFSWLNEHFGCKLTPVDHVIWLE